MKSNKDNQQERSIEETQDNQWLTQIKSKPELIWYIVGFSDGEGSLNISIKKTNNSKSGWKVVPVFNISQKERAILARIKSFFGCGTLRDRKDGVFYYEVESRSMLKSKIIPFFKKYPFRTEKKLLAFQYFVRIVTLLDDPNWDSYENMVKILDYRDKIIVKRKRKYTKEDVLAQLKSSETTRQTLPRK